MRGEDQFVALRAQLLPALPGSAVRLSEVERRLDRLDAQLRRASALRCGVESAEVNVPHRQARLAAIIIEAIGPKVTRNASCRLATADQRVFHCGSVERPVDVQRNDSL